MISATSVNIQSCCDARKVIAALPKDQERIVVGVILGNAIDFIQRANPNNADEPFKGFAGTFEVVPANNNEATGGKPDSIGSGNLFLPLAFDQPISKVLTSVIYPDADKPDKKVRGGAVRFALQIILARAANDSGYTWGGEFLEAPASVDPLADLKAKLAANKPDAPPATPPAKETAPKTKAK